MTPVERRNLIRWRPPVIPAECEWWSDTQHRLAARLNRDQKRGQVVQVGDRVELAPGWHAVMVRRLKPRPPARRRAAIATAALTLVLTAAVYTVYAVAQAADWLLDHAPFIAGCLLLAGAVLLFRPNHRAFCPGLHCAGCRGH